jgi:hypothetical protein
MMMVISIKSLTISNGHSNEYFPIIQKLTRPTSSALSDRSQLYAFIIDP